MDTVSFIQERLAPIAGKKILDMGCGHGQLAATLSRFGAKMSGIDTQDAAVAAAKERVPDGDFRVASSAALPFVDKSFDAVIFLNSLHHVPVAEMVTAMEEASRVLGSKGHLVVIEPLPEGSFFQAFRDIEDETVVRLHAQGVITSIQMPGLSYEGTTTYMRRESFVDFDAFLVRACAADPTRQKVVDKKREIIREAFERNATMEDSKFRLDQPLKADVWSAHA